MRPWSWFALLCLALPACIHGSAQAGRLPTGTLRVQAPGGPVSVSVQIAESPQARQTGLMGRRHLEPDAGMVFLFDQPTAAPFWMKDTPIPLSIAFWGRDRRIVAMIDTAPCRADPCPLYDPHATYVGAVEVNAGFFSSHRIEVGDDVALSR